MKLLTPYVLFEQSDWSDREISFLRQYLKTGMNVLDIGAGFGVYSLLAAKKVGETGKVFAFEPEFQSAYFLELSKKINGLDQIEIQREAISGNKGKEGWKAGDTPELSRLDFESGDSISTTTIDDWWESAQNPDIDVLKIDINGFEAAALEGGATFLSSQNPVLIVSVEKSDVQSISKILKDYHFELYEYVQGTKVLTGFQEGANASLLNIVAMKADKKTGLETDGWFLDENATIEEPDENLWKEYLTTLPWTNSMMFGWEFAADEDENKRYFEALNYLIAAEQTGEEVDSKSKKTLYLIEAAHRLIDLYSSGKTSTSVSFTLVRAFNALGKFDQSQNILQKIIDDTTFGQRNVDTSLPFLLPVASHDHTPIRTDFSKWLMVRIIEAWILQKYESTFWLQGQELQLVEVLEGNPELSHQMENVLKVRSISKEWDGTTDKPKSLLFITTDFPPYDEGRVGHSIRAYTLANFFAEHGYQVNLLILAKMVADREAPFMHENIQIINPLFHQQKATQQDLTVEEFCTNFMKAHKVPTLVTSSPPLTSHLIALSVKNELKDSIFWISDFRDFIYIHPLTRGKTPEGLQEQKEMETEVMQTADSVITVSTGMVNVARDLHLEMGENFRESNIEIVENGYIEQEKVEPQKEVVDFINQSKKEGKIVLYYAGTGSIIGLQKFEGVYKDLTFIFDVFQNNPEIAKKFALVIQGKVQVNLDYLKKINTPLSFQFFDPVPNALMQANLEHADIGLSVNSDEIATPYIMGGKLYDYANAGLALLLIYPENPYSLREFSAKHGDKAYFANVFDNESVQDVLSRIIMDRDQLEKRKFSTEEIKPYSRKELYKKFLQLIESRGQKQGGKFIHFCYNSIYAQTLADLLDFTNANSDQEHILYVECEQTISNFSVNLEGYDHAQLFNKNSDGNHILQQINDDSVDGIFMHGLFRPWQFSIVNTIGDQKHVGWIIWGGDLYNTIKDGRTHLFPADKLSSIHTPVEGDIQLFKNHFGEKESHYFGYPYPGLYGDIQVHESQKQTKRVIVGNSGDPSNHHIDILEELAAKSDIKEYKIILPVAYNFREEYRKKLIDRIDELGMTDQVEFHAEFIAPDDYLRFLENSELMIMAHNRQQAMGNILMALYLNKPVFLRRNILENGKEVRNLGWEYLAKHGLNPLAFEELGDYQSISEIPEHSDEMNRTHRDAIEQSFGLKSRSEKLQKSCSQIKEKTLQLNESVF